MFGVHFLNYSVTSGIALASLLKFIEILLLQSRNGSVLSFVDFNLIFKLKKCLTILLKLNFPNYVYLNLPYAYHICTLLISEVSGDGSFYILVSHSF